MTPEQQRTAIAEACGWKTGYRDPEAWHPLPDYLNDLNAMHDAEKVLTGQAASDYDMHLWIVIKRDWDEANNPLATIASWHATAAQRAEAFLRTIGKWEGCK